MPEALRIFVSSVMRGMESERNATRTAIASMHLEPWTFETLPAYPESPREVSLELAKECDLFVQRIGPSISPIVIEKYHTAREDDSSKVLILAKVCARDAEASAHLESVSPEHKYRKYGDARDLPRLVQDSIAGWISRRAVRANSVMRPRSSRHRMHAFNGSDGQMGSQLFALGVHKASIRPVNPRTHPVVRTQRA